MLRLCVLLSSAAVLQGTVLGDSAAHTAPTALTASASASASPGRFEDSEVPFEPEQLAELEFSSEDPAAWAGDALIVGVFQEDLGLAGGNVNEELLALDAAFSGMVSSAVTAGMFTGGMGESLPLFVGGDVAAVVLAGMGPVAGINATAAGADAEPVPLFQTFGQNVAELATGNSSNALYVVGARQVPFDLMSFAYGFKTRAFAGPLPDPRFASVPEAPPPTLTLLNVPESPEDIAVAEAYARGTLLSGWLTNTPANVGTTEYMAAAAQYVAGLYDTMEAAVLEREDAEALGMGAYLSVTQGSSTPPKFVHLTYTPPGGANGSVALIGKGITFDSGGYNLKAGAGSLIEVMNRDKAGAAAVLGAARTIGLLQPDAGGPEIHFIAALCENMINADATHPGDVVTSAAGTTIEIANTDAEGRLTLVDALWYAQAIVGVDKIVDIATLTGSALFTFGPEYGAVMGVSGASVSSVIGAGARFGERSWPMPIAYGETLASAVADISNIGSGGIADMSVAAAFLSQWIAPGVEWVHVDMAGPGFGGRALEYGAAMLAAWASSQ